MSVLRNKLLRDLSQLRGPVITIAIVVACGVAAFATMLGTYESLLASRDRYYRDQRFADVFVRLHRAPRTLKARIEEIPGVAKADLRIVELVRIPMREMPEPAQGTVVSIARGERGRLNDVRIVEGRNIAPGHTDEILLLEAFAEAHGLAPGDSLDIVVEGQLKTFRIAGLAMSPEFVFAMPVGAIAPDAKRFAVVWMPEDAAGPAFGMEGAFNDVVIATQHGAVEPAVIEELDRLLDPYGGAGAHGRSRQASHFFLSQELLQLENLARFTPAIFLAVAAFLLNVVLARLVQLQRGQIATLKAVGYGNRAVGFHYLELVLLVVFFGCALGLALGAWLGRGLTDLYMDFFRMPTLAFRMPFRVIGIAVGISVVAGVGGAMLTVRNVAKLPPAEAMRPPAPPVYRRAEVHGALARFVRRIFGTSVRMIFRELRRRPLRLLSSVVGIALAVGILVVGRFFTDAIDYLVDVYMHGTQREDVTVALVEPVEPRGIRSLEALPGVLHAEGMRSLPVRLRSGHRKRTTVIHGYPDGMRLRALWDAEGRSVRLPQRGAILTTTLAEILDVEVGEWVTVDPLEGDRQERRLLVAGTIDEMFGTQVHMGMGPLHAFLGEAPSAGTALLEVRMDRVGDVLSRLSDIPAVLSAVRVDTAIAHFRAQSAENMRVTSLVLTLFAMSIAVGVVYNNARIALSMRARDLASLRVLGFTRTEISLVLIGELAAQVLLALPLGWYLGYLMAEGMMASADQEIYRLPAIISVRTYAFATAVTMGSAAISALLVRRKLDRLDLVGVLKTRE